MKRFGSMACIGVFCFSLTSIPVAADVSARYETAKDSAPFRFVMTVEVDDKGNVRSQMDGQPSYFLVIGDVTYIVTKGPKGASVAKMDDVITVLGEATKRMGFDDVLASAPVDTSPAIELVPLGTRVVNGRVGVAYGSPRKKGEKPFDAIVISDDPKLAPLGKVFSNSLQTGGSSVGKMMPGLGNIASSLKPEMTLLQKGAPLQFVMFTLTDVSFNKIPVDRFVLPAEPMTLEQLRDQYTGFPAPPTLAKPSN